MSNGNNLTTPRYLVTAAFLMMVAVNALANILPINGVTTGQVSNSFPNLFAPAASTFAIWGLIYLLLGLYTVYQWGRWGGPSAISVHSMQDIRAYFIFSSLANAAWILAWHNYLIWLSVLLMLVILFSLTKINQELAGIKLEPWDRMLVRLPFSVYFGWITVATIANITVWLVAMEWGGFGLSAAAWTIIAVLLGLAISSVVAWKNQDIAYGLVIIWAYGGILNKHLAASGFAGRYPQVVVTVILALLVMTAVIVAVLYYGRLARHNQARPQAKEAS